MRLPSLRLFGRPTPRKHYAETARIPGRFVDQLTDADLDRLNRLLPWRCFTVDSHGRPLGGVAWQGKRTEPQLIPDPRIEHFHERFDLSDKHVLEIGCFEGVHTIALCRRAARVTAVDARVENVVKTIVRCAFFDAWPRVFMHDVEDSAEGDDLLHADVCHHVGVLYHLADPISHLRRLGTWISVGLMLDTHYAREEDVTAEYELDGERFRYRRYEEHGRADVFSSMRPHSKWLLLDDIAGALNSAGFDRVDIVATREERNGPRVLLFAART